MKILLGKCVHTVKVTYLKGIGWGVRVFTNGELNQQDVAQTREEIGPKARAMLRMEDKCGNDSGLADNARHRATRKELARRNEQH